MACYTAALLSTVHRLQAVLSAVCGCSVILTRACNNSDGAGVKPMQNVPFGTKCRALSAAQCPALTKLASC